MFLSALAFSLLVVQPVFAAGGQEEEEEETKPKPKPEATSTSSSSSSTTTSSTTTAAPSGENKTPDHEMLAGRLGVGYLGQLDIAYGAGAGGAGATLPVQMLGIRYWSTLQMGFTAGIGVASQTSSVTSGGTTVDGPAATAVGLKGGVVFALATGKHYTFVLEPQAVIGYASQTIKPPTGAAGGNTELTGTRIALGATVGSEIQFGFIGIPELALVGSIGLAFDSVSAKTKTDAGEISASKTTITTFTLANPWNIFSGNVAAIYYF
jgi:hypothetical protein